MSLPDLTFDQFPRFFAAVHGYEPFLWQSRMAKEVIAEHEWPAFVSLPTSAGKTALIDVAVFALACEAHLPPAERRAPLRIFFVIDRRVVADEAHARATKIAEALGTKSSTNPVLGAVAARLEHLAGKLEHLTGKGKGPLRCALLRGGIALDDDWIRSPLQPTVCVSTVDQVGSRLLFRGYGVPPRQRSIHAAMIAHDSLIILDEAHISPAFRQTVEAVQRLAGRGENSPIRPLRFVPMTATPPPGVRGFALQGEEAAETEMAKRISKKKPTSLEAVAEGADEHNQTALVARAVSLAEAWGREKTRVIGIVVNRVLTARRIFEALDEKIGEKALFIGRIREWDRDRLWEKWRRRLTSDPQERQTAERTVFIVATQTIEVGADLDFDALISELAPLSALRQRFGRLNRRGRDIEVAASVLGTKEQIGTRYVDTIYGKTLAATWKWLQAQQEGKGRAKTVNFAHENLAKRLEATDAKTVQDLSVLPPRIPLLHGSFVDAWSCTAMPLMHDPEVAPFLHGEKAPELEVQIVWRADLDESVFQTGDMRPTDEKQREDAVIDLLGLLPPSSREALPVPLFTAVRWLQQLASLELTDTADSRDAEPERTRGIRPVIIWRNKEDIQLSRKRSAIRPGDVLIVPSSYGGADEFGWIGSNRRGGAAVPDLAEETAWQAKRAPFIRFHSGILAQHAIPQSKQLLGMVQSEEVDANWKEWLAALKAAFPLGSEQSEIGQRIAFLETLDRKDVEVIRAPYYRSAILRSRLAIDGMAPLWTDDGNDEASQTERISLKKHLQGVATVAGELAARSGLPSPWAEWIVRAAELHDIGKADPRTQVIFFGSEAPAFAAVKAGELLAKSSHRFANRTSYRQLLRLAGLPAGARHETLSVFLADAELSASSEPEGRELILHLIAAHHGYARPLLRQLEKPDTEPESIDLRALGLTYSGPTSYDAAEFGSMVPTRFLDLQERHGWWGLAWFETLLRLADWIESARSVSKSSP